MNFLKHILLPLTIITLASCQSVDYYGKSYEKNGFFHCMMLEYAKLNDDQHITNDDRKNCANYKKTLQKTVSNYSLLQEENYYKQLGATCKPQKNILECTYSANVKKNVMYDAYVYSVFKTSLRSHANDINFIFTLENCNPNFSNCYPSTFLNEQTAKVLQNRTFQIKK
jgi:hypothetical protein